MIKNFNVPLLDARGRRLGMDGELAKDGDPTLLVADVAISACQMPIEGDETLSMSQKIKLGYLAIRIGEATGDGEGVGPREYSEDELEKIKERGMKNVRIMAFARLCQIIDAKEGEGAKPIGQE